ncbi:MAG: hypothetical protein OHK0039_37470 [Bacteroidia bacterium]
MNISQHLTETIDRIFVQIEAYLARLDAETYARPLPVFSSASVGQHTRHIIEFFQCLIHQASAGTCINYELRQRDPDIETQPQAALQALADIRSFLAGPSAIHTLTLETCYDEHYPVTQVETTFDRELIYNIEHAIHHLAMIKIGLREMLPGFEFPKGFGVAPSTERHRTRHTASDSR